MLSAVPLLALLSLANQSVSIPAGFEDRLIKDLVDQASGRSGLGGDAPQATIADLACARLLTIGRPAVPALVGALHSPKGWAKANAMRVLAQLKDRRAVPPMLSILHFDPEMELRGIAAYNLGACGDAAAVPDLLEAALSTDRDIARGAWKSLGDLHEPRAIPILIKHLDAKTETIPVSREVPDDIPVEALVSIGPAALEPLAECFRSSRGEMQSRAAVALGRLGSTESMAVLHEGLADPETWDAAVDGYISSRDPEAERIAMSVLGNEKHRSDAENYLESSGTWKCLRVVRAAISASLDSGQRGGGIYVPGAVRIIRRLKDRESVPVLIRLVEAGENSEEAIRTLGEFQGERAIPALLDVAKKRRTSDDWGSAPTLACAALAKFGVRGALDAEDLLRSESNAWPAVAEILSDLDDPTGGPTVVRILGGNVPVAVRQGGIEGLGQMKYAKAADLVAKSLDDLSDDVHYAAVLSLARIGDARAIEPLADLTRKYPQGNYSDEWMALGAPALPMLKKLLDENVAGAAKALAKLKSPESTNLLVEGLRSTDSTIPEICAKALGERKATVAESALLEALNRPEVGVRYEAYMALKGLAKSDRG